MANRQFSERGRKRGGEGEGEEEKGKEFKMKTSKKKIDIAIVCHLNGSVRKLF